MIQTSFFFSWILLSARTLRFKKIQRTLKGVIITQGLRLQGSDGDSVA